MGLSKAEVKLRRLLASMPRQENERKLVHYVATARELLTVLTGENAQQNLPSISMDKAREYGEQIEAFAEKINVTQMADMWDALKTSTSNADVEDEFSATPAETPVPERNLRKRHIHRDDPEPGPSKEEVKLDSATHEFIGKHRRLQDDLTDEMVALARHMKESTLLMQQSLQDTDKVVDATGEAVERSLASANRVTRRAGELYSRGFSTGCYTWLLIFAMFCVFIFMIAVIRIT
ncbi:uncharacterized protein LOC9629337 [Selaginella moellendorffii]|uniref:uncharacterized protein LOC9629337 n=1 Tax=Selaginella moellendorffii TaxID=88036 RepID=UPI000D1CEF80|nr:uncharacterized protein LOC9629337 [Selaginella moellendorffii]XP_024519421.1 uncharacterized protein LOC9629337 [Selaginella moellendorffii]|eukprot:XP_024519420.1 uncharacterized protein LOC9629337 [Selaginella moellendorffii]